MLLLLPPSETKRDGGDGKPLDLGSLLFPELTPRRRATIWALTALSTDVDAAMKALKLSARQSSEVARNRAVVASPTMPAIDRYTGVLYDALDAATLDASARKRAATDLIIQSALLGPVSGADAIPAYRLSHDSKLPGLPLKKHWAAAVRAELDAVAGLVLDLRSEGYAALGPMSPGPDRRYLRVVSRGDDGTSRALNHFNKSAKGVLTRALLQSEGPLDSMGDLLGWADDRGVEMREGAPGELELVVPPGAWRLDG